MFRSHSWIFDPVLVPGDVVVGGVLMREVLLLLLGEVGPRQERQQPVEIDHLKPVCLDGVEAMLMR